MTMSETESLYEPYEQTRIRARQMQAIQHLTDLARPKESLVTSYPDRAYPPTIRATDEAPTVTASAADVIDSARVHVLDLLKALINERESLIVRLRVLEHEVERCDQALAGMDNALGPRVEHAQQEGRF